jgi:hypothetical protein
MAPPRHKRGRSSTSSRASANLQKTEVTINVYDLLPVSKMRVVSTTFAGRQQANQQEACCQNWWLDIQHSTTEKIEESKHKLTSPTALPSINTPLDHWIFPPPLRRSPLRPKQGPNRIRLRRPPSPTKNRRLPHATSSNPTRSSFPLQHPARNIILATSRDRCHHPADSGEIHGTRIRPVEQELQPLYE